MELKKLQSMIQEGTQTFDETLYQIFLRKVKTEMVIYQVNTAKCQVSLRSRLIWQYVVEDQGHLRSDHFQTI